MRHLTRPWSKSVPTTRVPPSTALWLGISLRQSHIHNGPIAVSKSISIPTSAAGMRLGPKVMRMNEIGTMMMQCRSIHPHPLLIISIGCPAAPLTHAVIAPERIRPGVMSLAPAARSLTNLPAKAMLHPSPITSPIMLGLCHESKSTHDIPIIDTKMATHVIGGGFSLRKIRPKTAANSGWVLIITKTFVTDVSEMAETKQIVLTVKSSADLIKARSNDKIGCFGRLYRHQRKTIRLKRSPRQKSKSNDCAPMSRIIRESKLSTSTPNAVRSRPFIYSECICVSKLKLAGIVYRGWSYCGRKYSFFKIKSPDIQEKASEHSVLSKQENEIFGNILFLE